MVGQAFSARESASMLHHMQTAHVKSTQAGQWGGGGCGEMGGGCLDADLLYLFLV